MAQVTALVSAYDDWRVADAVDVVWCESRDKADVDNGDQVGLFQVDYVSHQARVAGNREALKDPATNVRIAHDIEREEGWRKPWPGCYPGH